MISFYLFIFYFPHLLKTCQNGDNRGNVKLDLKSCDDEPASFTGQRLKRQ